MAVGATGHDVLHSRPMPVWTIARRGGEAGNAGMPAGFRLPPVRLGAQLVRALLTAGAAGGVILMHGFDPPAGGTLPAWAIVAAQLALIATYYADAVVRQRRGLQPIPGQRFDWIDGLMFSLLAVGLIGGVLFETVGLSEDPAHSPWILAEAALVWLFIAEMWRLNIALTRRLRRPGVLFPLSFLFLIAIGTVLIKIPFATPPDRHLSWLDALFTMTSASCITGLTVLNISEDFTPLGQAIIIIFVQLGAIGFILFGSMVALLLGQRIGLRGNMDMSHMLQGQPVDRLRRFTRFILVSIVLIELTGALILYIMWPGGESESIPRRIGMSLFHSISAFCNAGFDLNGDSLVTYRYAAVSHLVIVPLIVLGGIGFPVLSNLASAARHRLRNTGVSRFLPASLPSGPMPALAEKRLTLHTKLVISTTIVLYLVGTVVIGIGQASMWIPRTGDLGSTGLAAAVLDAGFLSVTARSAGLTTVPMEEIQPGGRFMLIILMFIGGSPGGAAGGIKTTALAILIWSVISTLRQRRETEIFGRSISDSLVRQAGTIAICYSGLIVGATLLLSLSESAPFGIILFEAVSAGTTTGLSLGLTPDLTPFGKFVIITSMYLGRIGPLALFAALALRRRAERPYAYPHEAVALG